MRRSLAYAASFAVAAILVPAATLAQTAGRSAASAFEVGALAGVESLDQREGPAVRADAVLHGGRIAPAVEFAIVASLGYSRWRGATSGIAGEGSAVYLMPGRMSSDLLRLVPAARLTFGWSPTFRPFVDAGIGFYWGAESRETLDLGGTMLSESSQRYRGVSLRLAAGLALSVTDALSLGADVAHYEQWGWKSSNAVLLAVTVRL